jgi:hypothetical protein
MPAPPDTATAGPPPSHLPHVVVAPAAIESRPILSAGAPSSAPAAEVEEQCGPQPAPPQAEAAAMAGARERRVRGGRRRVGLGVWDSLLFLSLRSRARAKRLLGLVWGPYEVGEPKTKRN